MRGIEEKKGREQEEKKRRKGRKNRESNRKKSPRAGFFSAQSSFLGLIRNTLCWKKQCRSIFVFMEDIIDE